MLNTARRMSASLAAALMGSIGIIGASFSHMAMPIRRAMTPTPAPSRKIKPPKVKGIRTIRAEGSYGRNLRFHFDDVKRTPAQRNAFQKTIVRQA